MKKIFFFPGLIFFLLICHLASVSKTFAAGNFTSRYSIIYEVEQSGSTSATYQVNITNLTTQYYVSEYDLFIPSTKVEGIIAADRLGKITPQVTKQENVTKIHIVFNDKAVGKGSILAFALSYKTPEIAQKNGRIWEINLPPKAENPEIVEYKIHLKVPPSFGQPAYVMPQPVSGLTWTKEQLTGGVALAFGDYQLFNFHLSYHLGNAKLLPVYTEIVLPSDNAYQRIKFAEIKPAFISVREDEDGNWLARYNLSPGEKIEVAVSGWVKILPFPEANFLKKGEKMSKYLLEQKYWETTAGEMQKLAKELQTPRAIYDYVVLTLTYDYQKAQEGGARMGAKEASKKPKEAICMEFADLFITLARAAGIPAREVDGFAYTTNSRLRPLSLEKDILHSWAEFWDEDRQTWVMVDPTWGATTGGLDYFQKLDFNHFVLAIKGVSSELPAPAGAYKLDNETGKDVIVEASSTDWEEAKPQYDVFWNLPKWVLTGLQTRGSVEIKNVGPSAVYEKEVKMDSSPPGLLQNEVLKLSLPPGANYKLDLEFKKQGWFKNFTGQLLLTIDGQAFSTPFAMKPLGWTIIIPVLFCAAILAAAGIFRIKHRGKKEEAVGKNGQNQN